MFLYDNLPIYLLIFLVLFILSIFVYIKLAFPFWNVQPVYHIYDFWRVLYSRPFRIYPGFHPRVRTKYCRPDVIDVIPYADASIDQKKAFVNLVQCYSSTDEAIMCMFHLENLEAYMTGHIYGSYLSFYKDILYTTREGQVLQEEKPRGCIASRSGELVVGGHKEAVYWIDYLVCKNADVKMQRELFDTHIYGVALEQWSHLVVEPVFVWLFRRVGELLSGVVPLYRFVRREYEIPNNPGFMKVVYPEHVVLVEITGANLRKMTDTMEEVKGRFSIWGMMDRGCLIGLIRGGVIQVYILERMGEVLAMYFFRDMRMMMEGSSGAVGSDSYKGPVGSDGGVMELAGSIYIGGGVGLFRRGFLGALGEIKKKNSVYRRLCIDDISDNGILEFGEWYCFGEQKGAYYTWNLVANLTSSSKGAFILF